MQISALICCLNLAGITKIKYERRNEKNSGCSKLKPSCKWPFELGNNDFQNQRTRIQVSKISYVAKNQAKMPAGVTFWFPV